MVVHCHQITELRRLVAANKTNGYGGGINWKIISKELNRGNVDCKSKWGLILASTMKKGPFTAAEDALILQRVREWGDRGMGLWVSLEKEMGRSNFAVLQRWRLTLSKR